MALTNEVPLTGIAVTIGDPRAALKPAGSFWMPAKMVASSTEMKVKKADAVPSLDIMLNVRGSEATKQMTVTTTLKTTVRQPPT